MHSHIHGYMYDIHNLFAYIHIYILTPRLLVCISAVNERVFTNARLQTARLCSYIDVRRTNPFANNFCTNHEHVRGSYRNCLQTEFRLQLFFTNDKRVRSLSEIIRIRRSCRNNLQKSDGSQTFEKMSFIAVLRP